MDYLHRLTLHSHLNKMTATNLAICFSINILYPKPRDSKKGIINLINKPLNASTKITNSAPKPFNPSLRAHGAISKEDIDTTAVIVELLIQHAGRIGEVSGDVVERIAHHGGNNGDNFGVNNGDNDGGRDGDNHHHNLGGCGESLRKKRMSIGE